MLKNINKVLFTLMFFVFVGNSFAQVSVQITNVSGTTVAPASATITYRISGTPLTRAINTVVLKLNGVTKQTTYKANGTYSYTFSNLPAGTHTLSVTVTSGSSSSSDSRSYVVTKKTYIITAIAGTGGSISPSGSVSVIQGNSQTFTITPNTASGYEIQNVNVDGGTSVGAVSSYTFNNVNATHMIEAYFRLKTYTVTAGVSGTGGTISPASRTVSHGGSTTFTVTPNTGYYASGCTGGTLSGNTVTVSNVTSNRSVSVSFSLKSYAISASAGTGGSISPSGSVSVTHGSSKTFTITPNTSSGYEIQNVTIDGGSSQGPISSYTFSNVTAAHMIQASFRLKTYTVTAAVSGTGGTISPASRTVSHGGSTTFTVTPNTGYNVSGCTGGTLSGNTVTVSNVTSNRSVTVSFAPQSFTFQAIAGTGGSISPGGNVSVNYGENKTFYINPNTGYEISAVYIDGGGNQGALSSYTFYNVTASHLIQANFSPIPYNVSVNIVGNGSVTPMTQQVNHGGSVQLAVTPDAGWTYSSTSEGTYSNGNITVSNITSNKVITITFIPISYTINVSALPAGTATFDIISQQVTYGGTATFNITGYLSGYYGQSVNQGAVLNGNTITRSNVTSNLNITLTTSNQYTVSATAGANGQITGTNPKTVTYNQPVTFETQPNSGYYLSAVSAGVISGNNFTIANVTQSMNVTATFSPLLNYTLTTSVTGQGTISRNPSGTSYASGTVVTLTATPSSGYEFTGWSGHLSGTTNPATINMNSNKNVTATFTQASLITKLSQSANSGTLYSPAALNVDYKVSAPCIITVKRDNQIESVLQISSPVNPNLTRQYLFEGLLSGSNRLVIHCQESGGYQRVDSIVIPFDVLINKSLKTITYTYNHLGALTSENINNDVTYYYTYDTEGRLHETKSQVGAGAVVTDAVYTYNAADKVQNLNYSVVNKNIGYTYKPNTGWLDDITNTEFTASHEYFNNGNISSITFSNNGVSGTAGYAYDDRNRLTNMNITGAVNIPSAERSESYTYNGDGAFLTKNRTNNVYGYSYINGTNKLNYVTQNGNTKQFIYDAKGNVTYDQLSGVRMTEYDRRNLPLKMAVQNEGVAPLFYKYDYNDSGNRVIRESKDSMERYLYDASGRAVAVYGINNNQIKYAYLYGNDMVGKIDFSSTPERFYNIKDHLGNTRLVYDDNGSVVDRMDYFPYGEFFGSRNLTGMQEGDTKFHFTGKERDFESGYDYFGARYYNNRLGLWNSVDPMSSKRLGLSSYNYCQNNPINRFDPNGMFDERLEFEEKTGKYLRSVDDGKKEITGALVDENNKITRSFVFNDQSDAISIKTGKPNGDGIIIKGINTSFEKNIEGYLSKAGANESKGLLGYGSLFYAAKESLKGGKMDFVQYLAGSEYNKLSLSGNRVYNAYDAGNYLWGKAMNRLGINYITTFGGAEANAVLNSNRQNNKGWLPSFGDQQEDRKAYTMGFFNK